MQDASRMQVNAVPASFSPDENLSSVDSLIAHSNGWTNKTRFSPHSSDYLVVLTNSHKEEINIQLD